RARHDADVVAERERADGVAVRIRKIFAATRDSELLGDGVARANHDAPPGGAQERGFVLRRAVLVDAEAAIHEQLELVDRLYDRRQIEEVTQALAVRATAIDVARGRQLPGAHRGCGRAARVRVARRVEHLALIALLELRIRVLRTDHVTERDGRHV